MSARDIYEVANQLGGYVGPDTPEHLATFLLREAVEAGNLAARIAALEKENAELKIYAGEKSNQYVAAMEENARLREAANAVIAQWDTPNWKLEQPTAVLIERLRSALRDGGGE